MHLEHKLGEQMEVDWAGDNAKITYPEMDNLTPGHLFVAVLSSSGYTYVEVFRDQGQESWITGYVHAYRYFGGITRILTPDNLKTGITRHGKDVVILNPTYQEMAEHDNTCIFQARLRHPKDKLMVGWDCGLCFHLHYCRIAERHIFHLKRFESCSLEEIRRTQ